MTATERILLCLLCLAMGVGGTMISYEWQKLPAKRKSDWRVVDAYSYRVGDNMIIGVSIETTRKASKASN